MANAITAHWEDWDGTSRQSVRLTQTGGRALAKGSIIALSEPALAGAFEIECDAGWRVRRAYVELAGGTKTVCLTADGEGNWFDGSGRVLPALQSAVDIDLSATPFTNTLPIRRCGMQIGDSVDITTAYVAYPALTFVADPQRYTRLAERRYRYQSRDSDFTRDIEVDGDGLVIDYPGLFRRIA